MVQQLSVFLQNQSGKIAAITEAFLENGVDIRALSIADTTDFGILRILVSDLEKAKQALDRLNCIYSINEVFVVAVPDVPGGLAGVLRLMSAHRIDIEYMYSLVERGKNDAYMVFRVSDPDAMQKLLAENDLMTVSGKSLGLA